MTRSTLLAIPRPAAILLCAVPTVAARPLPDRFTNPGFGCIDSRMDFRLDDPTLELQLRSSRDLSKDLPAPLFTALVSRGAAKIFLRFRFAEFGIGRRVAPAAPPRNR